GQVYVNVKMEEMIEIIVISSIRRNPMNCVLPAADADLRWIPPVKAVWIRDSSANEFARFGS
ncbi:hypothetical protein KQ904_15490, partial [Listeria monocytogenes]|nr:hypothetical protein [Listeria monocytogenes]